MDLLAQHIGILHNKLTECIEKLGWDKDYETSLEKTPIGFLFHIDKTAMKSDFIRYPITIEKIMKDGVLDKEAMLAEVKSKAEELTSELTNAINAYED